ncbi:hypothetical protein JQS43_05355 [Natronosporangium hydrolyticum]|uniref:Uncharacterized protein n=1 Tax=Natronosporangium hydrolyticum TaxID=2811111 RepID=A0A895YDA8_9ACTN|nr:DUF6232 family protein [Natronosporangium hydrolyticum]QSB15767.1 hypothetical protein JQS43_05355 [Natronosporangium hydrolyticum]
MTTYYRDSQVRVTDRAIEVGPRVFPTDELTYVWHERGRPTLETTTRRFARFGLIAILTVPVFIGGVLAAGFIAREHGIAAQIGLAVALVGLGVVLLMLLAPLLEFPMMALERSYDRGTSVHEIWVRWRHQDLLLYRTDNAARFGAIYRAIQRAVEREEV